MPDANKGDAPSEGRHTKPVATVWSFVVNGLAALGTTLICVLMVIICADIVARNLLGSSLPLVSESGALLVVLIVALQLSAAVQDNRLARTEFLLTLLETRKARVRTALEAVFCVTGAAIVGAIAWSSFDIFLDDYTSREFIGTPGLGTLPTWPFRLLIMIGMAAAAIEFLVRAYVSLRFTVTGGASHEPD